MKNGGSNIKNKVLGNMAGDAYPLKYILVIHLTTITKSVFTRVSRKVSRLGIFTSGFFMCNQYNVSIWRSGIYEKDKAPDNDEKSC